MSLSERYRKLCSKLYNGTSRLDVQRHNRAMDKLDALDKEIESLDDKSFMIELVTDCDPRVRLSSSVQCLIMNIYVDEALKELESLHKSCDNPSIRCSAYFSARLWKEGRLK